MCSSVGQVRGPRGDVARASIDVHRSRTAAAAPLTRGRAAVHGSIVSPKDELPFKRQKALLAVYANYLPSTFFYVRDALLPR